MDEQFYICTEKGKFDINMREVEALRQKDLKSMQASFESNRDVRFPPRDDSKSTAIASCNKILSDSGLDYELALTPQMATDIYNYYNKGKKDRTSIYRILVDSVGFVGIPTHFDPGILLVKGGDKYEHEKGKKEIPMYKIFHWEVYTKYHNGDYFGIRTCLNDHCGLENHNILFKCDITTKTGQINPPSLQVPE